MTWREHTSASSRRNAPELCKSVAPKKRGRRKRAAPDGTRSPCAGNAHGGPQAPRHARRFLRNGFNGFLRALPGDEFLFVTVTERMSGLSRPGWADKTSAGLTSATDARTTRLRRPQRPSSTQVRSALCGLPSCGEGVQALFVLARA